MVSTSRELAYHILLSAEKDNSRYIDDILGAAFAQSALEKREKAWVMEIVYGISRMRLKLDLIISNFYKGRYHKSQHAVKVLLRLGVYQLKFMSTPDHAAINETVNLARIVKQGRSTSIINAILRQVEAMHDEESISSGLNEIQRLALSTSHPAWMLERWIKHYDKLNVVDLCAYNNRSPAHWVRYNPKVVDSDQFEGFLESQGVQFTRSLVLAAFYRIDSGAGLVQTREFESGWFSFQDIAAGIVASLVTPGSGESVLDACSAPGGKMAFIAEQSGPGVGPMYAFDASPSRLEQVKQTVQRLGLEQIKVDLKDAGMDALPATNWVLLDVPCSGTGVLGRRPDARWKKQPEDIDSLRTIQSKILINSWKHLLKDGRMIYATCSLEPEENWQLIDEVTTKLKNAMIEPILDENLQAYVDERGALSTLPWRDNMDGMFAVRLRKIS